MRWSLIRNHYRAEQSRYDRWVSAIGGGRVRRWQCRGAFGDLAATRQVTNTLKLSTCTCRMDYGLIRLLQQRAKHKKVSMYVPTYYDSRKLIASAAKMPDREHPTIQSYMFAQQPRECCFVNRTIPNCPRRAVRNQSSRGIYTPATSLPRPNYGCLGALDVC